MIDSKYLDDLKEIADTLGYEEQSMQLIEEMAELTQAINKHRRYESYATYSKIAEEVADVTIMLEQIQYLLEIENKALDFIIDEKIARTKQRILESGKNIERGVK